MEAGRFSSRPGQAGSRFVQPGSRLNRDVFFHVNTCCRDGMEGGMILVYWNKWLGLNERSKPVKETQMLLEKISQFKKIIAA
jgi:hypothetical protein